MHGILTSDLLAKSIYCHVVEDGYAARVRDGKSYDTIRCVFMARRAQTHVHMMSIPVKIYSRDGHTRSSRTRTTPAQRRTNIDVEMCMFPRAGHP